MKLVVGFWVWCWWWSQSYLSGEMSVGEAAASDGRWIPILWVFVLFHDVLGGTSVVCAEECGRESLSRALSVSSMVQDRGIWRLGSLGEEVCCCEWSWRCIFFGVLLGVVKLGSM